MLGPIVTAYEQAMTEGEGKNTWRTDRYSPCPRREAGAYLAFLASIGYQLSAIEQALADDTPYTGDRPFGVSLADDGQGDPGPRGRRQPGGHERLIGSGRLRRVTTASRPPPEIRKGPPVAWLTAPSQVTARDADLP